MTASPSQNLGSQDPASQDLASRDLAGRVALVTGASRNIGRAIALSLAQAGCAVIVAARSDRAAVDEVASAIEAGGGRALPVLGDVTEEDAVARIVAAGVAAFGRLDILVNNAAVRTESVFEETTLAQWRAIMALALDAPFLCARAALPHLARSDAGAIVNIGGLTAYTGATRRAAVVAAKAGLDGLTKALAHDLGPHGVTVNLVSPGLIETVRTGGHQPHHHVNAGNIAGRRGTPEEVAAMVRFLAGPGARYVTGQTMHVNGGAFLP